MTKSTIVAALAAFVLLLPTADRAVALCPPDAPTPFTAGPVSPTNGFAEYVTDSNGVSLELCLDGDGTGICFFDPVVSGNLFSQQIGFGPEAFWWLAEAALDTGNLSAGVVMAAEAAFATEDPADGDQFPFTRLRIRLDVPAPGIYTVTHPYGVETYTVEVLDAGDDVNETHDIPFTPGASGNLGRVGPWLTQVDAPAGYVGSGELGAVTGSPCGTNFITVSAVGLDGEAIDLGSGPGNSVTTDQFVVHGKLWDGLLGTPLAADRTTYERAASGAGQVDVFATSTASAGVTVAGGPNLPSGPLPLGTTGNTKLFRSEVVSDATVLPSFLELVATDAPTDPTRLLRPLVDVVRITRAEYDLSTGTLTVEATSSDERVPPTLTVAEYGVPVGEGIVTVAPPARVTVVSSHGGRHSEPVIVVSAAAAPGNRPPVANADAATTPEDTPVTVSVLANDTDPDGDTLSVHSVADATNGTVVNNGTSVTFTPALNFFGTGSFTYVASDGRGGLSSSATVTVTILAVNDPPVASPDSAETAEDTAVTILVLANDTDVEGDTLTVASIANATNGTAVNDGTSVTFTPAVNFSGTASFTYVAADGNGGLSSPATVTVTVTPVNDPPVAVADVGTATSGGAVTLTLLANDTDVDGPFPLTVANLTDPAASTGAVALNADQTVTYTAPANFVGTAVFTYQARDGLGALSSAATVTVTVSGQTVDLDIRRFTATSRVRLSRNQAVSLALRIQNTGTVAQARLATVVGVQNGVEVYRESLSVSDPPRGADTSWTFPSYTPTLPGAITWTATVFDDDPDEDVATVVTQVVQ